MKLYERWWNLRGGYNHALLLWLQRDYVFRRFEEKPAQPGFVDDTPYDFDHICPQSHWSDWTGKTGENRLICFHAEKGSGADTQGHWRLGNSIGNVRVWDSSENRGDGDAAPYVKLKLEFLYSPAAITSDAKSLLEYSKSILRDSAITESTLVGIDEIKAWIDCSFAGKNELKNPKDWDIGRALAFQTAIEVRAFNLYQRFYKELNFDKIDMPSQFV